MMMVDGGVGGNRAQKKVQSARGPPWKSFKKHIPMQDVKKQLLLFSSFLKSLPMDKTKTTHSQVNKHHLAEFYNLASNISI